MTEGMKDVLAVAAAAALLSTGSLALISMPGPAVAQEVDRPYSNAEYECVDNTCDTSSQICCLPPVPE